MVEFSKNKWKYSTIGLLVVLVVGFSFPQAFAAASANLNDIFRKLTSVETNVNAIKANTDGIQEDVTDIKDNVDALPGLIETTRGTISFSETLTKSNPSFTVFENTFPLGGIVIVDVSGTQVGERLGMTCDGGGIFLFDGHHEIPRFCKDNLKFGLSVDDPQAEPSVQVTGNFIVTNVEPLDP